MNSTDLAIIQLHEIETIQRAAKLLALSGYFDAKGDSPQAVAMLATKIMAGRELGFGPFASANGVHIIQGKPSIGANLMAAAVKSSGRYTYRVSELTNERCAIEFFEIVDGKRESLGVSEFTIDDAKAAGLTNKENWRKFAKNMLFARALSNGVRWHTPDVFSGNVVYVPEELGAEVDSEGNVIDVEHRRIDTATGEIVGNRVNPDNDVDFSRPPQDNPFEGNATPPHQRLWGIGRATFGPDWDNGARAWIIGEWTKKATTHQRDSASELTDDEKTLLGDYINKHAAKLQKIWRNKQQGGSRGAPDQRITGETSAHQQLSHVQALEEDRWRELFHRTLRNIGNRSDATDDQSQ